MRYTDGDGKRHWMDNELIKRIDESEDGCFITASNIHSHHATESFNELVDQLDPIVKGDTPEEVVGNLMKSTLSVPASLLRRLT